MRERFGGPACRIFRLLLLKRQLEQKQIADMAMIPVAETRELLYRLFKVEFVHLQARGRRVGPRSGCVCFPPTPTTPGSQEVARTADHSPSRTFYLWRVDLLRVIDRLSSELYRTVTKARTTAAGAAAIAPPYDTRSAQVRARLRFELHQEEEVMVRIEPAALSGAPISAESRARLERVKRVAAALEATAIRLDALLLLFIDV